MPFSRLKNLGLLTLVLILALICSAAFLQTRKVTATLTDVEERLIPAMGVIYPIGILIRDASEQFHQYHERGRVTARDVRAPLVALGEEAARLSTLLAHAPANEIWYKETVREVVEEFGALSKLAETGSPAADRVSRQADVVSAGLSRLRARLRALAGNVAPENRDAARPIVSRASSLLRVASGKAKEYSAQGPSPILDVVDMLRTADSRLGDLMELRLSTRLEAAVTGLRETLRHIEAAVLSYQDDEQIALGDASSDTLQRLHEETHGLWQQAEVAGTWITRNLHREVFLTTQAAGDSSRRGQAILLGLGLAGMVVAGFTALFLSRTLSRHVTRITVATKKFAAGDFADRLPAPDSDLDDMALLAKAINQMADETEVREVALSRLAAAVEHIAEGVLITAPDGTVEYVNPAFETITGLLSKELTGQNLGTREDQLTEVAATGTPWSGRRTARRGDGTEFQELCSISPVLSDDGTVERLAVVVRDITRDVQIEERVKESQKLQALGTLAGGIAHDFNNLLVPILAYSEMLLTGTPPLDPAHRKLQRISGAAERAKQLVEQVLTFSRASEQEKAPLQIAPLVKEVVKLVGTNLNDQITVSYQVAPDLPPILGDPVQLHQALMNLLTNAAHAMEDHGGELTISLGPCDAADHVCLGVQDTGCGMSPELQGRIFEPFFTTKGVGKGTGLGLSVVHGIVEDHGGTIEMESELGVGTRFLLRFPITASADEPVRARAESPRRGSERILLVDDEPAVAEVLRETLEELGYRVTITDKAAEALDLLSAPEAPIDLLLTDQRMPGMTGTELIQAVRTTRPSLPILLCTGHFGESEEFSAQTSGADEVIFKPVHPDDLGRAVRNVLDRNTELGFGGKAANS